LLGDVAVKIGACEPARFWFHSALASGEAPIGPLFYEACYYSAYPATRLRDLDRAAYRRPEVLYG
jgi:hypothetical protein